MSEPTTRANPLDSEAKRIWLEQHIPYRLASLLVAGIWAARPGTQRDIVLIHGRWMSQLLGIAKSKGRLVSAITYQNPDDVRAKDLDRSNVDPEKEILPPDDAILLKMLQRADQAVAHPTSRASGIQNTEAEQALYDRETSEAIIKGVKILLDLARHRFPECFETATSPRPNANYTPAH